MKTLRYGFGLRIGPIVFLDKSQSESTLIPLTPTEFYKLRPDINDVTKKKIKKKSQLGRSCVKVEVDVLGSRP